MVLVEHASLMKGAIPVLPICLAYFCLICNIFLPGSGNLMFYSTNANFYDDFHCHCNCLLIYSFSGTIISGFLCLCIGIPRFSQHDGARGRIGSFVINWIVGISQAFTIIFCFVGWGWSVWWGTIMLTQASKLINLHLLALARLMKKHLLTFQNDSEG